MYLQLILSDFNIILYLYYYVYSLNRKLFWQEDRLLAKKDCVIAVVFTGLSRLCIYGLHYPHRKKCVTNKPATFGLSCLRLLEEKSLPTSSGKQRPSNSD